MLNFDGINDFARHTFSIAWPSQLTIRFYLRPTVSGIRGLFDTNQTNSSMNRILMYNAGFFSLFTSATSDNGVAYPNTDQWNSVEVQLSLPGGFLRYFLNGLMLLNRSFSNIQVFTQLNEFILGVALSHFQGHIQRVQILPYIPSGSDSAEFWSNGVGATSFDIQGSLAFWPCDNTFTATGNVFTPDLSPNQRHLQLLNGLSIIPAT